MTHLSGYEPHWGMGHPTADKASCPWCKPPTNPVYFKHKEGRRYFKHSDGGCFVLEDGVYDEVAPYPVVCCSPRKMTRQLKAGLTEIFP